MATEHRPCEGCKRKLPKAAHPNRRFCTRCRKKRGTAGFKRNRKPRPDGARTKCTPRVIKLYVETYAMGLKRVDAAARAGVSVRAIDSWFTRARVALEAAGIDPDEPPPVDEVLEQLPKRERPYVEILLRSQRARADNTAVLFAGAHKLARGGAVWERNPNHDPEDPESKEFVQTGFTESDIRAIKLLLAIRDRDYSERYRQEVSGPEGGPVPLGVVITLPPEDDGPPDESE